MRNLASLITFIIFLAFNQPVWCQTLYLTTSDSHSNYDNLVKFLEVFEVKVENFKSLHPAGKVVLLINGDYGGASGLASAQVDGKFDAGAIGNNALKALAKKDITIVFNSGNHEAHDFAKTDKNNQRYVEQMKDLKSSGENLILIGTNQTFLPSTGLDQIFVRHFDHHDPSTGTNRVLGLTLQDLETKSAIVSEDRLFSNIEDYKANLTSEIEKAIQDKVSQITIMIHDQTPVVADVAREVEAQFKDRIKFNAWIAGHDHVEAKLTTAFNTPILNAGSQFGFMDWIQTSEKVGLNEIHLFGMTKYNTWKKNRASSYQSKLALEIKEIRESSIGQIDQLKGRLSSKSYGTFNIKEGKLDMKKSLQRSELGLALANSMKTWAQNEVRSQIPTVGLFNTSSYRVDQKLGEVNLSDLHILEMYPFIVMGKIQKIESRELLEVIQKTVLFQENINSMQLSDNLRLVTEPMEIFSKKKNQKRMIEYPVKLEFRDDTSVWREFKPQESVIVGFDDWTSINGYKLKYSSENLKRLLKPNGPDHVADKKLEIMFEVLKAYLPQELEKNKTRDFTELTNVSKATKTFPLTVSRGKKLILNARSCSNFR